MSKTIREIFDDKTIKYYQTHKEEITSELLKTLRSKGREGKEIALEILDTEKSEDNFYLDAFGNKISFNGNRSLKKAFTQMKLYPIHLEEIKKCKKSLDYYRENYVQIRTKSGYTFCDMRAYQKEFLDIIKGKSDSIVSLQPRQSGKSITVGIYLSWQFNFGENINIGICANKSSMAREFLNNVKNMFLSLPMWLRVGVTVWNKGNIEGDNKMRILTDAPSQNSFRGFTVSILVVDECAFIKSTIYKEFEDSVMPSQSALAWKKNILISTANGMNHFYDIVKGAKARKKLYFNNKEEFKNKNNILNVKELVDGGYEVTVDEPSNNYAFYQVDWRDVPRYDEKGNVKDPNDFKQEIIEKYGDVYFNQNYACVHGDTKVRVYDDILDEEYEITVRDLNLINFMDNLKC